jgi:erythronate-4-phosphate dehydrogenase
MSSPSIRRCIKKGKTLHLADEALIRRLKPGTILINACRGPVVDNAALLKRLEGQPLSVVLDVWEPEPDLNVELLSEWISVRAYRRLYPRRKARGTTQVFEAYSAFIGHPQQVALDTLLPARSLAALPCTAARSANAEKTGAFGV